MIDWIQDNPLYEGVNWTSALEVAMRSMSWIWTLASLSTWQGWQDDDLAKMVSSLYDHALYLSENFSFYSSPYNHLIGEATGLFCLASVLGEGPLTQKWRQQSRRVLIDSGRAQFYDDHFCVEQAIGYHYFTLGFLTIAWCAARATDDRLDELTATIQAGFQTAASFRRPDGSWPAIGDLDSARAIPVHHDNYWCFDSLHHLAAVLFDDSTLKLSADNPGEELFWLGGVEAIEKWSRMDANAPETRTQLFPDAGYAVASDGDDWLLFDAGPIAAGVHADATPSTAHGHADTMQVLYSVDGRTVLDDSGMPFYGGAPNWVTYFRSPAAHNAVQIDGAEVVRRAGRLAWSHEVNRPTPQADLREDRWLCSARLTWPGISHQRFVCCIPGQGLWVADLISTDKPRNATWFWQLPNREIALSHNRVAWECSSLSSVSSAGNGEWSLQSADVSAPEGWRCLGYGEKRPAKRLSIHHQIEGRLIVLTSVGKHNRSAMGIEISDQCLCETNDVAVEDHEIANFAGCRWFSLAGAGMAFAQCSQERPDERNE